jgi:putative endonuclease
MDATITTDSLRTRSKTTAESFLKGKGYTIIDNWKCGQGNVGFVVEDDDMLVFIEVMSHKGNDDTLPHETSAHEHRTSLESSAAKYLAQSNRPSTRVRFDIISLLLIGETQAFLRHHIDALSGIE